MRSRPRAGCRDVSHAGLWRAVLVAGLLVTATVGAFGQREPILTPRQVENLRDTAQEPNERLNLYVKYIGERIDAIHRLTTSPDPNRGLELHRLYGEFAGLSDELDDNLATYDQQKSDMRKGLALILKAVDGWATVLKAPAPSQQYDIARSFAMESLKGLQQDATQMLAEQNALFVKQKKQKHH